MAEANNKILVRMLDRLFAGLVTGPNLNCRPHASRQRLDLTQLAKLGDLSPEAALEQLLGKNREAKLTARIELPRLSRRADKKSGTLSVPDESTKPAEPELSPQEKALLQAWNDEQAFLRKLRILVDEARTYEQDTGVHVLNVGFPVLHLPPGSLGSSRGRATAKRVLAPIAFVPVSLTLRSGTNAAVVIACKSDEVDRVTPNTALLAWLEQQTGIVAGELITDEEGEQPWRALGELVRHVAKVLNLPVPEPFADAAAPETETLRAEGSSAPPAGPRFQLQPAPRADDDTRPGILLAGVLGLFPMNNQGLLRDMQALVGGEASSGPIQSFIQAGVSLDQPADKPYEHEAWSGQKRPRVIADERFVTTSDPCQARAVRLARECRGLVVHGPPGTGKSQTITNIIGDHLARGERVLMVCDKRTALDVVANRLEHLGLGQLCALVHDPQRDQLDLYRSVREQLEALTEAKADDRAGHKLKRLNAELQKLHAELTEYWSLLMSKEGGQGPSFHELVGEWLRMPAEASVGLEPALVHGAQLQELEQHEQDVQDLVVRAGQVHYADNPWRECAGIELRDFLSRPLEAVRELLRRCVEAARTADAPLTQQAQHRSAPPRKGGLTQVARLPEVLAFPPLPPLHTQAQMRAELAKQVAHVLETVDPKLRGTWPKRDLATIRSARQKLHQAEPLVDLLRAGPLDSELELLVERGSLKPAALTQQLGTLEAYLAVASRWYGVFCWKRRAEAAAVLRGYGLGTGVEPAQRLRSFLLGLRARLLLQALHRELQGQTGTPARQIADADLPGALSSLGALFDLLVLVQTEPAFEGLTEPVRRALAEAAVGSELIVALQKSAARALALVDLQQALIGAGLFNTDWVMQAMAKWVRGKAAADSLVRLEELLDTLEGILRIHDEVAKLPRTLQPAMPVLLMKSVSPESALAALRKAILAAVITERMRANPTLQALDSQRLQSSFERYRALDGEKRGLVRDLVLHLWVSRQREQLVVSTGSRLSSTGADVRRRLMLRGERALRLRQVIALGQALEGGDPLFDLRPVWMASPETVAQIFPRKPLFDVVIFDEASQCRLEEALPVLTRAQRVVIAGDPKQLPPTRFFESSVAVSEDEEIETDQQLFEVHQQEIEDLLGAALSIAIQQCYLDVHYRSRNPDLIAFSNEQFYSARLQPIPGHPANRARFAPITLYRADGIYADRQNSIEAEHVCRIVRDLLKRAEPPSIGIACFNLAQRDLIVEKLNELALTDDEFASRFAEARVRRGSGSFEGLFVKNLENVQGDERDHIILSTTYGPDLQGRFYRRFGPLGHAGGGRRLNVLVTRAREEVHLVTSIPPSVYRILPRVPSGRAPGGAWLLFAYLAFAEQMAEAYEAAHQALAEQEGEVRARASVQVRPSQSPSGFARALAELLARQHHLGSDVHWGNDGFCVDLALHHPRRPEDVTIGLLCDGVRFAQAEDPTEWDVFRMNVLESQGWQLHRLWTPHFFRDVKGHVQTIVREATRFASQKTAVTERTKGMS